MKKHIVTRCLLATGLLLSLSGCPKRTPQVENTPTVVNPPTITLTDPVVNNAPTPAPTEADSPSPAPVEGTGDTNGQQSEPPTVIAPTVGFRCHTTGGDHEPPVTRLEAWLAMPGAAPQFIARVADASGLCDSTNPAEGALLDMLVWNAGTGDRFQLVRTGDTVILRERHEDEESPPTRWRTVGSFAVPADTVVSGFPDILRR